jgi:hypothetical protein
LAVDEKIVSKKMKMKKFHRQGSLRLICPSARGLGHAFSQEKQMRKMIGGLTFSCSKKATAFYRSVSLLRYPRKLKNKDKRISKDV